MDAISSLEKKRSEFYFMLSKYGRECYQRDAKEYLNKGNTMFFSDKQQEALNSFWGTYLPDYNSLYHQFYYNACGYFDIQFIPDDVYASFIDGYFNNRTIEAGFSDKNYFDLILSGFRMPKTYVHVINGSTLGASYQQLTENECVELLYSVGDFIVKPSVASYGGSNVRRFLHSTKAEIKSIFSGECQNIIIQEYINQSSVTESLHKASLNSIRIMTLMLNNKVETLSPILKMGINDSIVDNASSGGIFCGIKNGVLDAVAYDATGHKYYSHPNGCSFAGTVIPSIESVKKLVKDAALRFPHFRLIGWDVALNYNDEPVIIEANLAMSSIDMIQLCCGPLFGDHTKAVLDEVFSSAGANQAHMDLTQYI